MGNLAERVSGAWVVAIPLVLGTAHCRAPTEVKLDLSTDVPCVHLTGIAVAVGKVGEVETKPTTANQSGCESEGNVGTLTVVPSGADNDEVTIRIVAGVDRDPESCVAPNYGTGCIVARRTVRYVAHTPLEIDVPLRAACNGVACAADQTCVAGGCTSASIDASTCGSSCGENALPQAGPIQAPSPLVCGDSSGLQPSAPWPTLGFCPTHIGRGPRAGAQTNAVKWTAQAGDAIDTGVVVAADGTIYFGAADGKLYAVSAKGDVLWSTMVGPAQNGTVPTIARDGTIYIASADGALYAVAPTGAIAWKAPIGATHYTVPAVAPDGTIYVGGGVNATSMTALDKTGKQLWQFATGSSVYSAPAIALDGTILVGSEDSTLYDVDRAGAQKWKFAVGEGTQNALVAPNDWIYFTGKASVCAVDGGGALKWASKTQTDASMSSLASDGTVYAAQSGDGLLIAFDPNSGTPKWGTPLGAVDSSNQPIIGADGVIYMGSKTGTFSAVTPDGKIKWQVTAGGAIVGSAAIGGDGTVYFGAGDHKLYAVGP